MQRRIASLAAGALVVVVAITATDRSGAVFTTTTADAGNGITAAAAFADYPTTIMGQTPARYWRLDETNQSGPTDLTGNSATAPVTLAGMTPGVPGRITGSTAYSFAGSSCAVEGTSSTVPAQLSVGVWFKTTTSNGGPLVQFSDNNGAYAAGTLNDRNIYLSNAGNVVWGVNTGASKITIASPGTYRDGTWHFAVGTIGAAGMVLYVDGASVATSANTAGNSYTGYWHLGCGTMTGWVPFPTGVYTTVALDEVVIFTRQITVAEVGQEYAAAG